MPGTWAATRFVRARVERAHARTISAAGHHHDHGRLIVAVGAPVDAAQLVGQLVVGQRQEIGELNEGHRCADRPAPGRCSCRGSWIPSAAHCARGRETRCSIRASRRTRRPWDLRCPGPAGKCRRRCASDVAARRACASRIVSPGPVAAPCRSREGCVSSTGIGALAVMVGVGSGPAYAAASAAATSASTSRRISSNIWFAAARRQQILLEIADRIARLRRTRRISSRSRYSDLVVRVRVTRQTVHVEHDDGRRALFANRRHHRAASAARRSPHAARPCGGSACRRTSPPRRPGANRTSGRVVVVEMAR